MRRLALIWLFGIAMLGIEISTMLWMRGHLADAETVEHAAPETPGAPETRSG